MSLTTDELELLDALAGLYPKFEMIVGLGATRLADLNEIAAKIHDLQSMVMSQSAAREYPDRFRLLGKSRSNAPVDGTSLQE